MIANRDARFLLTLKIEDPKGSVSTRLDTHHNKPGTRRAPRRAEIVPLPIRDTHQITGCTVQHVDLVILTRRISPREERQAPAIRGPPRP